ncbi:hypothetical protein WH47_01107 [Habropoda laboriosa]|uniref:Uncharacterized protein n=1 Tax=Habropoda laboriosa TaxID=597456 RepID=A0A0L7QYZ5_9HYME|nr:hypothetical protein WH47_01107 [Habropoda laboriosa]
MATINHRWSGLGVRITQGLESGCGIRDSRCPPRSRETFNWKLVHDIDLECIDQESRHASSRRITANLRRNKGERSRRKLEPLVEIITTGKVIRSPLNAIKPVCQGNSTKRPPRDLESRFNWKLVHDIDLECIDQESRHASSRRITANLRRNKGERSRRKLEPLVEIITTGKVIRSPLNAIKPVCQGNSTKRPPRDLESRDRLRSKDGPSSRRQKEGAKKRQEETKAAAHARGERGRRRRVDEEEVRRERSAKEIEYRCSRALRGSDRGPILAAARGVNPG